MSESRRLGASFVRLLSAHTVSQLGMGAYLAAVPLMAASLTHDPRVIAGLAVASSVPALVLALPMGAWVDRAHRPRLMVGSDLVCFVVLATLGLTAALGILQLWMLILAAAILGSAQLLVATASFALVPSLVPRSDLTRANGYLALSGQTSSGILGPPAGGLAFAVGPFLAFFTTATSYLLSGITIASLARLPDDRQPPPRKQEAPATRRRELAAGLRYVANHRAIGATTLLAGTFGIFGWMPEATLVLFAREHLNLSPMGFGVLLAVTTLGAVVGGLMLRPLAARVGTARLIVTTHLIYGVLLIPVGLTTSPWVVGALFFLQGIPLIVSNAAVRSLQQSLTPSHLLGRVGAVNRLVGGISAPLGLAAGGMLAHWVGYPAVWVIAGAACTLITLALARRTLTANDASGPS